MSTLAHLPITLIQPWTPHRRTYYCNLSLEEAVAPATASADRIALAFMDQVGRQTDLREKRLQLNKRGNC
ncbi:hypothetical protein BG005_002336, partial [Podila minutissima]